LDIGCGGGIQYAALSDFFSDKEWQYTGVDITPKMLNFARKSFPDARFDLGDAADLDYQDEEYDVCVIRHVLEHHPLNNGEKILHEALRIAKNAVLLLFFIEPQDMSQNIVEKKKESGIYLNTYSKRWLMRYVNTMFNNRCSIDIINIPKTPDSPALYNQFLYFIKKS
jgi:ubiquinone/menaquinone biosynthesis C-methylase UbiE